MCGVSRFAVDFLFLFGVLFAGLDAEICEKRYGSRERERVGLGSKNISVPNTVPLSNVSLLLSALLYIAALFHVIRKLTLMWQLVSIGLSMGLFSVCHFHVGLLSLFRAVSGIWQGYGGWPLKNQTQSALLLVAKRSAVGASACLMELWRMEHLNTGEEKKRALTL